MALKVEELRLAVEANLPVLLLGGPGTAKTAIIRQLCDDLGYPLEIVIASQRQPEDFLGLPYRTESGVKYEAPAWALRLVRAIEKGAPGAAVLFDEVSCVTLAVQAALLTVVQERRVGELQLPAGVRMIAAANPPEQAAGGWEFAAPTANRWVHLDWSPPSAEEWGAWALSRVDAEQLDASTVSLVCSFLAASPGHLYALPVEAAQRGGAWPSPRSWWAAVRALSLGAKSAYSRDAVHAVAAGAIGRGALLELLAYAKNLDLPDPEYLLKHPRDWNLERGQADRARIILCAVATAAIRAADPPKVRKTRFDSAWEVLARGVELEYPALAVVAGRLLSAAAAPYRLVPPQSHLALVPLLKAAGIL